MRVNFVDGPRGQKVTTIGGLRLEVSRFGQLKIGHRILEPEEAESVAEAITVMAEHARKVKADMRRPRRERQL